MNMMEAFYSAMANAGPAIIGHRFYRLSIYTTGTAGVYCWIPELQLREVASGPSVATGGTASSPTGSYSGYPASNAFDGSTSTSWGSLGTTPNFLLEYDFGSGVKHKIVEYAIYATSSAGSYPASWDFQYSDDGTTWTTADHRGTLTMAANTWYTYTVATP